MGTGKNFLDNILIYVKFFIKGREYYELPYIPRLDQIGIVAKMLSSSSFANLLVGFGPGSSLSGNFSGNMGVVAAVISSMIWNKMIVIQWTAVAGDLGVLGIILFGFLFYRIFIFIIKCKKVLVEPKYKIYTSAFVGIFVFYSGIFTDK